MDQRLEQLARSQAREVHGRQGQAAGDRVAVLSRSADKVADAIALGAEALLISSDNDAMKGAASRFGLIIDTVQLGWSPYAHDYDTLATWLVVQGRTYTGDLYDGTETALLVRLFKGRTWVEFGATTDGKIQAMAMVNF